MCWVVRVLVMASVAAVVSPAPSAEAQVVRESDAKSIAGVVGGAGGPDAAWTFRSGGGEILFASLDGELYAVRDHEGHETATAAACEDEGGPARFCLQVVNDHGAVVCEASRPAPPPGWQRDPRMACRLPNMAGQLGYVLRVALRAEDGTCTPGLVSSSGPVPFLLSVSLRRIAPTGVGLREAIAQSGNRF